MDVGSWFMDMVLDVKSAASLTLHPALRGASLEIRFTL